MKIPDLQLNLKDVEREIIIIDAFVFAPGKEKRDYIQKLDFIVKSLRVNSVDNNEIED